MPTHSLPCGATGLDDDTATAFARLTASGAQALAPPHEWLGRLLIAWIADPDGNPIQIAQHLLVKRPEA